MKLEQIIHWGLLSMGTLVIAYTLYKESKEEAEFKEYLNNTNDSNKYDKYIDRLRRSGI